MEQHLFNKKTPYSWHHRHTIEYHVTFHYRIHIESQDEMISTLNLKISAMEQSRMNEKDAVRAMCWKELFERIDNAQKE